MSKTTLPRDEKRTDFYPTPWWCVHRLLEGLQLPGGRWLEPAAGELAIVEAVRKVRQDIEWTTVDFRETVNGTDLVADFTFFGCPELDLLTPPGGFDVCLTNPPFSQAVDFVDSALERAKLVVMLLRLDWLGSMDRDQWHRDHPSDFYLLPNRPSFDGKGSDSCEYAWFKWPGEGRYFRLAPTPKGVRKAEELELRKLRKKIDDLPLFRAA